MDLVSDLLDANICIIFTFCDSNTLGKLTKICKQYRYVIMNNIRFCKVLYGRDCFSICNTVLINLFSLQ